MYEFELLINLHIINKIAREYNYFINIIKIFCNIT